MDVGDSSEMGLVMKKGEKNQRLVLVPASPRTTRKKRRAKTYKHTDSNMTQDR